MAHLLFKFGFFLSFSCLSVSCEGLWPRTADKSQPSVTVAGATDETPDQEQGEVQGEELADHGPSFVDPGGDLGLRELTQMAQANSPLFAEAEGNLRVARATRRSVGTWDDPQLRAGFDWDDVRIDEINIPGPANDDSVRRNEQLATSVRLYPPNPFEVRAEMDKAMAEISYAEYYLRQVGRELVHEVREHYQELQFLQENIKMGQGLYRLEMEELERLKGLREGMLRDPVDRQRLAKINKTGLTTSAEIRFQQVRAELAALAGLADPSRIAVRGVPSRPLIGFRDDTVASLTEMAFMNNLELADLDRLQSLARGDLKAFKAKRIPWFSFIEGGRDRTYSRHLAISDSWTVRFGLDVPIFSMFSKEGDIYREQIRSYQKQAARYQKQIRRSVSSAVANIQETRDGLDRFDRQTREIIQELQEMEAEVETFPQRKADLVHRRRVTSLERSRDRLEAEEAYHDALLALEEIIRDDIEKVFRLPSSKGG